MRRSIWILGLMSAATLAACGPREQNNTSGSETGAGTATTDTSSMAPSATPMDTAMTGDTAMSHSDTATHK